MNDGVGGVATPTTTVGEGCGTVTAYIQTYRDFLKSKVEFWDTECFFNWILKYWTKKTVWTKKPDWNWKKLHGNAYSSIFIYAADCS